MCHIFLDLIILVRAWRGRHAGTLKRLGMKKVPYADFQSTASFAMAVGAEFIILTLAALFSCIFNSFHIWYGMFFRFLFHFLIHLLLCIRCKRYVPGAVTSAVLIPPSLYLLYLSVNMLEMSPRVLAINSLIGIGETAFIVFILHKAMKPLDDWLVRFEKGNGVY